MNKIRLLIIDGHKNTVVTELDGEDFKQLKIDVSSVKKHKGITAVKQEVSSFFQDNGKD